MSDISKVQWERLEAERKLRWYQLGKEYTYRPYPYEEASQEAAGGPVGDDEGNHTQEVEESPQTASESVTEPIKPLTAKEVIAQIKEAETSAEVIELLADDERKTVQKAASDRLSALDE